MWSCFLPQGFTNGPHCILGRGIHTHGGQDFDACCGDDVDDVARPLPLEDGQSRGNPVERAAQIDVDHGVPVLDAERIKTGYGAYPGIVDDDVQPAKPFAGETDQSFKIRTLADVGHFVHSLSSCRGDLVYDRCEHIVAARAQHDKRTPFCQQFRRRAADSAACARNGDNFSFDTQDASPSFVSVSEGDRHRLQDGLCYNVHGTIAIV
ncbi:hypothetical protein D3C72_1518610 [compost metagenome]